MAFSVFVKILPGLKDLTMKKSTTYGFGGWAELGRSILLVMVALSSVCCAAAAGEDEANPSVLTLERIFTDEEFDTEDFQSVKQDDRITIESAGTLSIAADSDGSLQSGQLLRGEK